jgi:hypothetical protein
MICRCANASISFRITVPLTILTMQGWISRWQMPLRAMYLTATPSFFLTYNSSHRATGRLKAPYASRRSICDIGNSPDTDRVLGLGLDADGQAIEDLAPRSRERVRHHPGGANSGEILSALGPVVVDRVIGN